MIKVVDYGVGNVQAFLNVFKRLGIDAQRAATPESLKDACHLILPGVGHFDHAMQRLNDSGMRSLLEELVLKEEVPILGVCVGMQMLGEGSDEGVLDGLNWLPGRVRAFASNNRSDELPMPHMGWNELNISVESKLFSEGFSDIPQFYFLHSFYFDALNKEDVVATASYGIEFDVVVSRGHIHGIQCHPEKSHTWGEQLIKNFGNL
jgi:glutamine amidotransferase